MLACMMAAGTTVGEKLSLMCALCMQEKRIRAQQSMKQLSKRMTEQRLRTLEHLRAGMAPGKVRILPRDVEQGLKEFASGVEQLVDRLVRHLALLLSQQAP